MAYYLLQWELIIFYVKLKSRAFGIVFLNEWSKLIMPHSIMPITYVQQGISKIKTAQSCH